MITKLSYKIITTVGEEWRFRSKSATDSDLIRPPIPFEIGH